MCVSTPVVSSVLQQLYDEIYRRVVDDQLDPICRFQADYRLTFVNRPYAALYDKRPEELIGQNMIEVIPSAYRQQTIAHLSSLSPQHPTAVDEKPACLADGSLHWFQWHTRLTERPDGTIEYQGVGRDVTARKQAEDAEREQRLYAEAMRDSLAALTSSLDVDEVMTQILASVARVVPHEASRIILLEGGSGRTAYVRGYSPEAVALLKELSVALVRLADGSLPDGKQPYLIADVHTDLNWRPPPPLAWIRSSIGVPITVNGDIMGLLVANSATPNLYGPQDIEKLQAFANYAGLALTNAYQATKLEQRVAERTAELQAAKEQVEAILNHSSHAIILVQPDLHIVQSNAVFGQLFPTYRADTPGQSLLAFVHPEDHVIVQEGVARVLRTGGNHYLQIRAGGDKDRYFDAELSIGPMDDRGFVCTLRDITERKARERQLLYYASIQESVNEAVIAVDLDYRIQSWNKAAETIFGWHAAEVVGQTTMAVLRTLYSGTENREALRQLLFEQGYWQGDAIQYHKDGTPRHIAASITLLRDAQGVPFGMVAISRDITEQRQTELALKESRHFTKQIIETSPNIIYVYNLLTQRHTYINHNITTMLGYSVEEFSTMGQRIVSEVMHPDELGRFFEHIKRLDTGKDGEVFTLEHRMRHKNGQWRWFLMQATIFQRAADGVPTQTLGVAIDITERKQATEALQKQRDFLQSVIDHVPGNITVKDRQGVFHLANQHMAQQLGTTPAGLVGKTISAFNINPHDATSVRQVTEQVFATKQTLFVPEILLGGHYYQADLVLLPGTEDEDDQVLTVATNITERKQAEIALQQALQTERELSELKSGFITTTSHEFRTPLTIILSVTETLRAYRHKLPPEQIDQRLDRIADQVQHLKALMEDVFDLSRMQARRVDFTPVHCNPATLFLALVNEFQDQAETTRHLHYTAAEGLPMADLDERLLRQILHNLIANAIKYSAADKPIAIHLTCADDALVLTVRDEGIGIPAADRKHLFLPFYRATNSGTIPGTGLGLSITKEAVELHGGTITVESQVGVGTTFTVKLPVTAFRREVEGN